MVILPIPFCDPAKIFAAFAHLPFAVFLDGFAAQGERRISTLAFDPLHRIIATGKHVVLDDITQPDDNPFGELEKIWKIYSRPADSSSPVPFYGGMIGAFGYELGGYVENLPEAKLEAHHFPLMSVGVYDTVAAFDLDAGKAWIISQGEQANVKAQDMAARLSAAAQKDCDPGIVSPVNWQPCLQREIVESNIAQVIDYIFAGDIFQANYTQKYRAERPALFDAYAAFQRLRESNAAPFSAFIQGDNFALASASPERFLKIDSSSLITAQPIKGTRPRHDDPAQDTKLAHELRRSLKDHAENLMIVDLMRNDLGRVAEIGSVQVPQLASLESFATVHHLVSTVTAQLCAAMTPFDVLRATFPGGSVTGAPKIRAMEIIHELEPEPRGFYCGCLGWIGFDGAMDLSMTIRTLTVTKDFIIAQAGGGIVADSVPAQEYEESMVKIRPLLHAVCGDYSHEDLAKRQTG